MPSAATRPTRTRLTRAERVGQTIEVAHALFAERGYAAMTMDAVAEEVGVTKPLLYHYFGNKERLYLACMERAGDGLLSTIGDAISASTKTSDVLSAGLRAFFSFLDEDRDAWAVLFDETLPGEGLVAKRVADYRRQILTLATVPILELLPEQRRQEARDEVDALAVAVLGAAEGLARWWLSSQRISAQDAAELLIAAFEPGLRSRRLSAETSQAARQRRSSPSCEALSL